MAEQAEKKSPTRPLTAGWHGISLQRRADSMLLLATFFWGWTFPVVKDAISIMPVFAFLALRFALATAVMVPLAGLPKRGVGKSGLLLGVLLFLSFAFQTAGLALTSSANCAFITGLNIIWVALVTARGLATWISVALGVAGLWMLARPDQGVNLGDALTVVSSLFIALHIIVMNRLDKESASGQVAFVQFAVVAVLSLVVSLLFEDRLLPEEFSWRLIIALVVTVIGATNFAFWVQTHYQRHTGAVRAALIFIMEPVFAAIFAVLFYNETLPPQAAIGAVLMFLAMLAAIRR